MFFKGLSFGFSMCVSWNGRFLSMIYFIWMRFLDLDLYQLRLLYITNMFNLDDITNENNEEHNKKWPYVPDQWYKIFIIGGFWSGKTNALLNLMIQQDDIDKIYLYTKNLS